MYKEVSWQELPCYSVPPAEMNNISMGKRLGGAPRHVFMVAAWHSSLPAQCCWWSKWSCRMEMLSNFLPEKKLLPKEVYVEDEKCSLWISLALRLADLEMLEGADLSVTAWPHPHMGGISTQWLPAGLESHQPTKFQVFCGWKTLQRFQKSWRLWDVAASAVKWNWMPVTEMLILYLYSFCYQKLASEELEIKS